MTLKGGQGNGSKDFLFPLASKPRLSYSIYLILILPSPSAVGSADWPSDVPACFPVSYPPFSPTVGEGTANCPLGLEKGSFLAMGLFPGTYMGSLSAISLLPDPQKGTALAVHLKVLAPPVSFPKSVLRPST